MVRKASVVIEKDEHGFYARGVNRKGILSKKPSPTFERLSNSTLKPFHRKSAISI
jgi:hypothetical protein